MVKTWRCCSNYGYSSRRHKFKQPVPLNMKMIQSVNVWFKVKEKHTSPSVTQQFLLVTSTCPFQLLHIGNSNILLESRIISSFSETTFLMRNFKCQRCVIGIWRAKVCSGFLFIIRFLCRCETSKPSKLFFSLHLHI